VVYVGKFGGNISHEVDREGLKVGDLVKCKLDWERRYKLMRMHTAAHVLSAVFMKEGNAKITGGELGLEKSRDDFGMEEFSKGLVEEFVRKANGIVKQDLPVKTYYMSREEVLARPELIKLEKGLPDGVQELRIVEIEGVDAQPDGGTHVARLGEIGSIVLLDTVNKGRNNRRVYFSVSD
jgi:misacylated tRNA(Ala) deacylase